METPRQVEPLTLLETRYTFFENFCLRVKPLLSPQGAWGYRLYRLPPGSKPISKRTPLKILELLTSDPGRTFAPEKIFDKMESGASGDKLEAIRAQIHILRGDLGDPTFIETVRSEGYRFIPKAFTLEGEDGEREWRNRGFGTAPVTETSTDEETNPSGDPLANCAQQSPSLGETVFSPNDNAETQATNADHTMASSKRGVEHQTQDPPITFPAVQDGEDPLSETNERELESDADADIGPSEREDELPPLSPLSDPVAIVERAPWRQRRFRWKISILMRALFVMVLLAWAFSQGLHPSPGSRAYYLLLGFRRYGLWVSIPLTFLLIAALIVHAWLGRAQQRRRGNKITILVTAFGKDQLGVETRERVVKAIREHLKAKRAHVVKKDVSISPVEADTDLPDLAKARTLLRREAGDLLIAGKVRAWRGKKERVELRFIPANTDPSRVLTFGFNSHYEIDADFGPALGAALAATVGAFGAAAVADESGYVERSLVPIAARLKPFAQAPPSSMRAPDQATLIFSYGLVQSVIGMHAGNPDALQEAVHAFRLASENWGEDREPLKWAWAQNHLGIVLGTLGAWGHGERTLEASRIALEHAIGKWPRETHLSNLAETHRNLGATLLELGKAEGNPARFNEAAWSFIAARDAASRDQEPLSWASAFSGTALSLLSIEEIRGVPAEHLSSERIAFLDRIQRLFEVALKDLPGYEAPLAWLDAAEGIGRTLFWKGVCQDGTEPLKSAIKIFGAVLEESPRQRFPVRWARVQRLLGSTIIPLANKAGEHGRLAGAVRNLEAAAGQDLRRRMPLEWARLQYCLGTALVNVGVHRNERKSIEDGLARLAEAGRIFKPDYYPRPWTQTEYTRAIALLFLTQSDSTMKHLEEAIVALRAVIKLASNRGFDDYILRPSIELGRALGDLGARCDSVDLLEEATALLQEVAEESALQDATRLQALAEYHRGVALFELAQRRDSVSIYREAEEAVRTALGLIPIHATSERKTAEGKLALILAKLSAAGAAAD